ncbi:MAG TPA: NADPH-dependent FMN reductase [Candidatus Saccharimonadales bacterium]|nr:NADPH-dependent FMN reductase [Candidatus Saccharimonadales bacterium]
MQKILVITGSTRPGRKGAAVAKWFMESTKDEKAFTFELADLAEINLPMLDEPVPALFGKYQNEHTKAWAAQLASADGFVIVTPEYNHGYPASLKNAIDYTYVEWNHKPVAFVSYGVIGGVRAVEQLKPVISRLDAVPLDAQVSLALGTHFTEDGLVKADSQVQNDLTAMIKSLAWWGDALKAARQKIKHA